MTEKDISIINVLLIYTFLFCIFHESIDSIVNEKIDKLFKSIRYEKTNLQEIIKVYDKIIHSIDINCKKSI